MNYKLEKKGFTLVEMMVAIAVFSVVMVTAMSALLNVIDANNKARSIKTAINNISFALEGISKDMRMGTNYECSTGGNNFGDEYCSDLGVTEISYKSPRSDIPNGRVYYRYNNTDETIEECLQKGTRLCPDDYQPITSEEVKLTNVTFYVLNDNADTPGVKEQPRMVMTVRGEAGTKDKLKTTFDLQTGVSQRIRTLPIP